MFGKKERRRRKLIDRKQQVFFAGTLVLYSLMCILVFLYLTLLSNPLFAENIEHGLFYPSVLGQVLAYCLAHWHEVLITLIFIGCSALLFSHQIFGPMHRLEATLLKKKNNPLEPARCDLRRIDYFQRFSKFLEEVLNGLSAADTSRRVAEDSKPDPTASKTQGP